jgi:hypothetical protein
MGDWDDKYGVEYKAFHSHGVDVLTRLMRLGMITAGVEYNSSSPISMSSIIILALALKDTR